MKKKKDVRPKKLPVSIGKMFKENFENFLNIYPDYSSFPVIVRRKK